MQDVAGKTAFITGAASGMGLGMARAFTDAGMQVMLADIDAETLSQVEAGLKESGANVSSIVCDGTKEKSVLEAAEATVDVFGSVHVLCNNAGVSIVGPTAELPHNDWDWVLGVNLMGVLHGLQAFVPVMKEQGEPAHVINTASIAGFAPLGGKQAPYKVTKFGVVALSEVLRDELSKTEIGVSVLCPGGVQTRIWEAERNRPAELGGPQDMDARGDFSAQGAAGGQLDPEEVGRMVLAGVKANNLYVMTHPETKGLVRRRFESIMAAFEAMG